jgi:hypothetical protein
LVRQREPRRRASDRRSRAVCRHPRMTLRLPMTPVRQQLNQAAMRCLVGPDLAAVCVPYACSLPAMHQRLVLRRP